MIANGRRPLRSGGFETSTPSRPRVDSRIDEAAVRLGRSEQWLLDTVRRRGTVGFVLTMTVAVVLASVGLTLLAMWLFFGLADDAVAPAMLLGMGVPAVVAPPTLYTTVRLTARLDTAGKLLRRAALTDPLTGVLNRRGFFEAVGSLAESGARFEVVMADIDDFKLLNDRHGHATGDLVLGRTADWLTAIAGEDGIASRMGGDEFAIVALAADRELPGHQSLVMEGIAFDVTLGSAVFTPPDSFESALAAADADLYTRKRLRSDSAD